jgi:hypothetical protein
MLRQYLKPCQNCISHKLEDAEWCQFPEFCDIHLSNGSVFEDVVQSPCHISDTVSWEDIEFKFRLNEHDKECRLLF